MPVEEDAARKRKLRWYQYSLRTLLIWVTLFAVVCSWAAVKMQQARGQKEAVAVLLKKGASIGYDYERVQVPPSFPPIPGAKPPGPAWLRKLIGKDFFINVTMIELCFTDVTDADLKHLDGMTHLHYLNLQHTEITDAGLEHLKGLKELNRLFIDNTKITDSGAADLKKALPNLEIVR